MRHLKIYSLRSGRKKRSWRLLTVSGMMEFGIVRSMQEFAENGYIYPDDIKKVHTVFQNLKDKVFLEFRFRCTKEEPYYWVQLTGSIFRDENGEYDRLVAVYTIFISKRC